MWCCLITYASGAVYMEYNMGPKTEPCGTPYLRQRLEEGSSST